MFNVILQVDAQPFFFLTNPFLSQGNAYLLRLMKSAFFAVYLEYIIIHFGEMWSAYFWGEYFWLPPS